MPTKAQPLAKQSSSAIATRSADSFLMFKQPEYMVGMHPLGTLQPLVGNEAGFFVKQETLATCNWTATEDDFDEGTVLWNHTHRFRTGARDQGHFFTNPNLCFVLQSGILIVEEGPDTKQRILGDFNDEELKRRFELDKLEVAEGRKKNRELNTRTKYLVFILTKDYKPAHERPIVLTTKGLVSVELNNNLQEFNKEMDKCLSVYLQNTAMKFDQRVSATRVFRPTLEIGNRGDNNVTVVCIDNFVRPSYATKEEAFTSLDLLTIPESDWQKIWDIQDDPFYQDYINVHSNQDAAKLKGAYGLADGVSLKPAGFQDQAALPSANIPENNPTGEDASL